MSTSNWEFFKIGDLVKQGQAGIQTGPFGTQLKASDYIDDGIPVINVRNIGFSNIRSENLEYIGQDTVNRLANHVLEEGDIVFARKGAVERHAFITAKHSGWLQGSDCIRLRIYAKSVEARFISYLFLTKNHQEWMKNQGSHGATMATLNQSIISQIKVSLPPLITQQRIADILSTYDRLIDNNNRRIALLEESIHQLYKEWFVRSRFPGYESVKVVNGIPEGWKVSSIGNLSEVITRGITPKYDLESKNIVLNQKCIRNYQINFEFARQHHSQVSEHKKIRFGDVLINSTGIGTLGRVAQIITNFEDLTVDTHITIVRPKVELEKHFFGVALENLQDYFDTLGEGATGQTELKRQLINVVPLLLPDENIRKYFDEKASFARLLVQKLLEQNQRLKQARDLLLPRLMNGSIAV